MVTGLWATPRGREVLLQGRRTTSSTDSPALPKPVQSPVPLIVGGGGRGARRALAARYATEFNIGFVPPEPVGAAFDRVRAAC